MQVSASSPGAGSSEWATQAPAAATAVAAAVAAPSDLTSERSRERAEEHAPAPSDTFTAANRALEFDTSGGDISVRVVDTQTGRVVREVPQRGGIDPEQMYGPLVGNHLDVRA